MKYNKVGEEKTTTSVIELMKLKFINNPTKMRDEIKEINKFH